MVKQYREMRKMMKQMGGRGMTKKKGRKGRKAGGGRTTGRGPVPVDRKKGLSLPGLGDQASLPGFPGGGLDLLGDRPKG